MTVISCLAQLALYTYMEKGHRWGNCGDAGPG